MTVHGIDTDGGLRRVIVRVGYAQLADHFTAGREGCYRRCVEGLPEGSRIVGVQDDPARRVVTLVVEHPAFSTQPEGLTPPSFHPYFVTRTDMPHEG